VIHAAKPHPDREIPQAQSAHDTYWDFVSLRTEVPAPHPVEHVRPGGVPASFRTMEGFGVHTFRLVTADGTSTLVKFH
jgi:catalase